MSSSTSSSSEDEASTSTKRQALYENTETPSTLRRNVVTRMAKRMDPISRGASHVGNLAVKFERGEISALDLTQKLKTVAESLQILAESARADAMRNLSPGFEVLVVKRAVKSNLQQLEERHQNPMEQLKYAVDEEKARVTPQKGFGPTSTRAAKLTSSVATSREWSPPVDLPSPENGSFYSPKETLAILCDPEIEERRVAMKLQQFLIEKRLVPVSSAKSLQRLKQNYGATPELCPNLWGRQQRRGGADEESEQQTKQRGTTLPAGDDDNSTRALQNLHDPRTMPTAKLQRPMAPSGDGDEWSPPIQLPTPENGSFYSSKETLAILCDPEIEGRRVKMKLQQFLIEKRLVPVSSAKSLQRLKQNYEATPELCPKLWGKERRGDDEWSPPIHLPFPENRSFYSPKETLLILCNPNCQGRGVVEKLGEFLIKKKLVPVSSSKTLHQLKIDYGATPELCPKLWGKQGAGDDDEWSPPIQLPTPENGSFYSPKETLPIICNPKCQGRGVTEKVREFLIKKRLVPVSSSKTLHRLKVNYEATPELCPKFWGKQGPGAQARDAVRVLQQMKKQNCEARKLLPAVREEGADSTRAPQNLKDPTTGGDDEWSPPIQFPTPENGSFYSPKETLLIICNPNCQGRGVTEKVREFLIKKKLVPVSSSKTLHRLKMNYGATPELCPKLWGQRRRGALSRDAVHEQQMKKQNCEASHIARGGEYSCSPESRRPPNW